MVTSSSTFSKKEYALSWSGYWPVRKLFLDGPQTGKFETALEKRMPEEASDSMLGPVNSVERSSTITCRTFVAEQHRDSNTRRDKNILNKPFILCNE